MDGGGPRRRRTTPVGRTGARFAPAAIQAIQSDLQPIEQPVPVSPPVGPPFGPPSARPTPEEPPAPAPIPAPPPPPDEKLVVESNVLIRPYARTGGRTRPAHDLALEALISTSPHRRGRYRSREHHAVANLCVHPRSVAEVAATLAIPLGVARVLLGDLAIDGTVIIHRAS